MCAARCGLSELPISAELLTSLRTEAELNDALLPITQVAAPTASGASEAGARPTGEPPRDESARARADHFLAPMQPDGFAVGGGARS